jgi:hypothetical protein
MDGRRSSTDDGAASRADRFDRELTESHAVLWTVVILASVFDVVTTMTGLSLGFEEGNTVVRAFIATYGTPGIGLLKFVALVLLGVTWATLPDRPAELVLTGFAVIATLTVFLNALTLMPM